MEINEAIMLGLSKKRISQKELGQIMGESQAVISAWVKGKSVPPGNKLRKLAIELDIVEELFPGYQKIGNMHTESEYLKQIRDQKLQIEFLRTQNQILIEELSKLRRSKTADLPSIAGAGDWSTSAILAMDAPSGAPTETQGQKILEMEKKLDKVVEQVAEILKIRKEE